MLQDLRALATAASTLLGVVALAAPAAGQVDPPPPGGAAPTTERPAQADDTAPEAVEAETAEQQPGEAAETAQDAARDPHEQGDEAAPLPPVAPNVPHTICEGRRISKLVVKGAGRVNAEDVKATVRLRKGMVCTDAAVTRDVQALWDMGYFENIVVEAERDGEAVELLFRIHERPAIGEIVFEGHDEVSKTDLEEKVTLQQGAILSVPEVRDQVSKLKELYAEKGFFLANVSYELERKKNNEVDVHFVIDEGEEVTVRRIRFIGNENLSAGELRSVMATGETSILSLVSSNNTFQQDKFDEDVNRLQALYYDYGYLTMEVTDARVELTPSGRHIDISLSIHEGPRFRVNRLRVAEVNDEGEEVEPLAGRRRLRDAIELDPGDWFSRSVIAKNLMDMTRFYRDRGYAKVEIGPQTELLPEERKVNVVVLVKRGPLVHINRINVKGNTKTRDAVVRRQIRIAEGDLYNQTLIETSKARVNALGFFESVETSESEGPTRDTLDLNFEVSERPTGTFQVGAGFSSQENFLFTAQIQQQNLFGRGQSLTLNLQLSGIRQQAQVRFVEPYLYGTDWTLSLEAFKILRQLIDFNRDSTGFGVTLGHPIFHPDLRLFAGYRFEDVGISTNTGGALGSGSGAQDFRRFRFLPIRNLFRSGISSSLRLSLQWDSRDNRLFPSKGILASASTEVADGALGSTNDFVRNTVNTRFYYPLLLGIVAKLNVEWGMITTNELDGVPVFERYFLGGIFDVRGFRIQGIGPRAGIGREYDPTLPPSPRGLNFGGNMELYYNLELEIPIVEAVGIKGVLFTDGGNAWNMEDSLCQAPAPEFQDPAATPCGIHPFRLRTSWGFGFRWLSPLGPLRFEWGFPFNPRKNTGGVDEDDVEFQFTVGNAF